MSDGINNGERKAFEYAANLVKQYRGEVRVFKFITICEAVIIAFLYFLLLWR